MEQRQDFGPHWEIAVRTIISPLVKTLPENQDNYLLIDTRGLGRCLVDHKDSYHQVSDWPQGHIRVALMDGMGGHDNGRQVAEATAQGLLEIPATEDVDTLSRNLEALHERLQTRFQDAQRSPGSTLTLIEIPPNAQPLLFHVGDSRLYEIDQQQARCLTVDHVPSLHAALAGNLSAEQWHEQVHKYGGNTISQAFVMGNDLNPDTHAQDKLYAITEDRLPDYLQGLSDRRSLSLEQGKTYLIGSDGLWARNDPQAFIKRWPEMFKDQNAPLQRLLDDLFFELIILYESDPEPDYKKDPYARREHLDNCTAIALRRKTG